MNPPIIEVRNLRKKYGFTCVLKGVDLSLHSGKFYSLVGRNGAGKSTLMRILAGHEPYQAGDALIFGESLSNDPAQIKNKIGYVSENLSYFLSGTVGEVIGKSASFYSSWDPKLFSEVINEIKFDLSKSFHELSRGQRMQIAFATMFSIKPKLLLLDEITSVLDAGVRSYFISLLARFRDQGGTVLLATNIVSETNAVVDEMIFLEEGRIALVSEAKELPHIFHKLKMPALSPDPIFNNRHCILVGVDPEDGSPIYLVPKGELNSGSVRPNLIDSRKVTAEEAFIYFTKKDAA